MIKIKLRKKDKVMILTGRDKGKTGEIIRLSPRDGQVLVGKVNIIVKHRKPTQTEPGGIQRYEAPIAISNVMLVCPKCEKPVRAKLDRLATGEGVRVCRKCGETIL